MKKTFMVIAMCILFIEVSAQTDTSASKIFRIHPFGTDTTACCVEHGSKIKFLISNVNTIKLNGYTLAKGFDFATPSPLPETKIPDISDPAKTENADIKEDKVVTNMRTVLAERTRTFNVLIEGIRKNPKAKPNKLLLDSLKAQEKIIESLKKRIEELTKKELQIQNAKSDFVIKYKKIQAGLQRVQQYLAAENQLNSMIPDILIKDTSVLKSGTRNYMSAIYGSTDPADCIHQVNATIDSINNYYVDLKKDYEEMNSTQIDSAEISGDLKSKNGSVIVNINGATVKLKKDPSFEKEFRYIEKMVGQITDPKNTVDIFNKAQAGINLYNRIQGETFNAYTDAQQAGNDSVMLTPVLRDKDNKTVQTFNTITVNTTGGIKVNFTTGYLLSFLGDDNYSYYSDGSAVKGIVKQGRNSLSNAIGAMAHVYKRKCKGINSALSGGVSVTTTGNIGFYLGGSLLFLEKNRLAISLGLSEIKVNKLDTGNLGPDSGNGKYPFINAADIKINYNSIFKTAVFVGITYNIFTAK